MARQSKNRLNWRVIIVVVLVALFVAGILLRVFLFSGSPEGEAAAQPFSSSDPDSNARPEPMPTSIKGLEEYEPETPSEDTHDCRNFMTSEEYSSFMERVYQFEVISQMQPSDKRLGLMYPYATEAFMNTQIGFFESPIVEGVSVHVDAGSAMGCAMNSENDIFARITPVVTVVSQTDEGVQTVLQGPMTLPVIHFTRWILLDGVWYVDQERK